MLERPLLVSRLERLCRRIGGKAVMVCPVSTDAEVELARALRIPLLAAAPEAGIFGFWF